MQKYCGFFFQLLCDLQMLACLANDLTGCKINPAWFPRPRLFLIFFTPSVSFHCYQYNFPVATICPWYRCQQYVPAITRCLTGIAAVANVDGTLCSDWLRSLTLYSVLIWAGKWRHFLFLVSVSKPAVLWQRKYLDFASTSNSFSQSPAITKEKFFQLASQTVAFVLKIILVSTDLFYSNPYILVFYNWSLRYQMLAVDLADSNTHLYCSTNKHPHPELRASYWWQQNPV